MFGQYAPGNLIAALAGGSRADAYAASLIIWIFSGILSFAGGGWGLFLMSPFWALHARDATYKADEYGANLGYKQDIMDYLDKQGMVPIVMPTPYFMSPEPFTELRHDKLSA